MLSLHLGESLVSKSVPEVVASLIRSFKRDPAAGADLFLWRMANSPIHVNAVEGQIHNLM
jgi:hypothetical protein